MLFENSQLLHVSGPPLSSRALSDERETMNSESKRPPDRNSTALAFLFAGACLLLIAYMRFSTYKTSGEIYHSRFGFTENGHDLLVTVLASAIVGTIFVIIAAVMFFKRRKND